MNLLRKIDKEDRLHRIFMKALGILIFIGFVATLPIAERVQAQEGGALNDLESQIPETARKGLLEALVPIQKSADLPELYREKVELVLKSLGSRASGDTSSDALSEAKQQIYAAQITGIGESLRATKPAISAHLFDLALDALGLRFRIPPRMFFFFRLPARNRLEDALALVSQASRALAQGCDLTLECLRARDHLGCFFSSLDAIEPA